MVDVYGSTSIHEKFWKCTSQCKHRAHCSLKKKKLVDAVKLGTTIKLEEVQLEKDEKGFYELCYDTVSHTRNPY